MGITEISPQEFGTLFPTPQHVYNSVAFARLNSYKADAVHYLLFADSKPRVGIILGERGGKLLSPFSAPFGGFVTARTQSLEHICEAATLLRQYGAEAGKKILITLPPTIYDSSMTAKTANALSSAGRLRCIDVNYHIDLTAFDRYERMMKPNARKNLHHAMNEDFAFRHCTSDDSEGVRAAYEVIRINREEHGYPLRMTLDDVLATTLLIPADFFVLSTGGTDVAAAQVFRVSDDIHQVIYWGDRQGFSAMRPMNRLAYSIFEFYHNRGVGTLDIGPSSTDGIPNYGLCEFKESIGCSVTPKLSFEL